MINILIITLCCGSADTFWMAKLVAEKGNKSGLSPITRMPWSFFTICIKSRCTDAHAHSLYTFFVPPFSRGAVDATEEKRGGGGSSQY